MLKASLTSLAAFGLLIAPAIAQGQTQPRGAPIVRGVTTGALSEQVDQTRQQTADLMLEINRNSDRINQVNGRIETLEFELSRVRATSDQQTLDNEQLARENAVLRQQLDAQGRALAEIQMTLGLEVTAMPAAPGPASGFQTGQSGPPPQDFASAGSDAGVPRGAPGQTFGQAVTGTGSQRAAGGPSVLTPVTPAQPAASQAGQLPAESGPLFALARQRLLALDYAGAQEAFQAFVDQYSNDPQAGEAYFWLGEALHQQQAYAESGAAYTTMIRSFPDDERAPDALARLARSMRLIGETERACQALRTLPQRYPNASRVVRDLAAVERTRSGCTG
ncbi:MAG: tol-pal system protein YbgF [Hyphomonas sp.]